MKKMLHNPGGKSKPKWPEDSKISATEQWVTSLKRYPTDKDKSKVGTKDLGSLTVMS